MIFPGWTIWSPYKAFRLLAIGNPDFGLETIADMKCTVIAELGTFEAEDTNPSGAVDTAAIAARKHFGPLAGPVQDTIRLWAKTFTVLAAPPPEAYPVLSAIETTLGGRRLDNPNASGAIPKK